MTALHGTSEGGASGAPSPAKLLREDPALEDRYRDYRKRQAGLLASLLPKEAVRPTYAQAREWSKKMGLGGGKDPLATLLHYLEELLPLPPFEVWLADRSQNMDEHLQEEFKPGLTQTSPNPPVSVESRGMVMGGRKWRASLNLFRREDIWRGFIAFRPLDGVGGVRTADIFREEDPEEIRQRFLSFHSQTLQAFLRSVLP
jgi:hypothetical protein